MVTVSRSSIDPFAVLHDARASFSCCDVVLLVLDSSRLRESIAHRNPDRKLALALRSPIWIQLQKPFIPPRRPPFLAIHLAQKVKRAQHHSAALMSL